MADDALSSLTKGSGHGSHREIDQAASDAEQVRISVDSLLKQYSPEEAWAIASQSILTPTQDFALHQQAYVQCYGPDALSGGPAGPAWLPASQDIARANVTQVIADLGLADYPALHRWSVEQREAYWELAMRRLGIRLRRGYTRLLDTTFPTRPQWLSGASLNIVESCFQGDPDSPAIVSSDGKSGPHRMSVDELRHLTGRVSNALAEKGIVPGDAVAVVMPMTAQSVALYLGIIAAGAAVVSIADSFAPVEIATRLKIAQTRLVFTQDTILRGDKRLPLYDRVVAANAPPAIVLSQGEQNAVLSRPQDLAWDAFLSDDDQFAPVARAPHDAINILFSSGTTGDSKAIPWDHTTPIKCAADAHFHQDLQGGDLICWPTNLGWMMGPWLIFAALINRATIALYDQSPLESGFGRFIQEARVTHLGLVPSLVRVWRQTRCMEEFDWTHIRVFSSSGECSNVPDMLYLMHLAGYRPVIEYCGGTEIGGAYLTATVVQPSIPAAFTTPALGIDFVLIESEPGETSAPVSEVFLSGPSLGLSTRLLNRDHDGVYFEGTPLDNDGTPLRRHGDALILLPNGAYRMVGRCDDTMNLGGIKIGCAEIERVLNQVDGVLETAAVSLPGENPSRLVVFVAPKAAGERPSDEWKQALQQALREQLNPLFRIDEVRLVTSLPRTATNKILRRELRDRLLDATQEALDASRCKPK